MKYEQGKNPNSRNGFQKRHKGFRKRPYPSVSKEIRKRISKSLTGRKQSEETKIKRANKLRKGIFKKCLICRKDIWWIKSKPKKYCSSKCRIADSVGKPNPKWNGTGNPNWKGDKAITPVRLRIRTSPKYQMWRMRVFKRDNFICVIGGLAHGNKLNADHYPETFASLLKKYKINTLVDAINCKKLWYLKLGRTLCVSCHKKTDTYGGKSKLKEIINEKKESRQQNRRGVDIL